MTAPTSRTLTGTAHALVDSVLAGIERLGSKRRARQILDDERVLSTDFQGAKLYYPSASIIGSAIASGSGWEPTLATALDLVLPEDEPLLVAEVGSNIGASLAQMIAVRPRARYVCFEPADRFRDVLVLNIEENDWENVQVEGLLVGSRAESVQLFTNTSTASVASRHYGEHVFLEASTHPMTTLDAYFCDAERLDLVKSDTDGFDFDVLLGAPGVLERLAPTLYFEFAPFLARRVDRDGAEVLAYLRDLGYERFLVFAQSGELLTMTDAAADVLGLADEQRYVDVLTAARPQHLAAFPDVVAATRG